MVYGSSMFKIYALTDRQTDRQTEHSGRWGQEAERYLNTLAFRARDCEGKRNHSEFVCYWRKRIAVIVQKVNAGVILGKLKRIIGSRGMELWVKIWMYNVVFASLLITYSLVVIKTAFDVYGIRGLVFFKFETVFVIVL